MSVNSNIIINNAESSRAHENRDTYFRDITMGYSVIRQRIYRSVRQFTARCALHNPERRLPRLRAQDREQRSDWERRAATTIYTIYALGYGCTLLRART